MARFSRTRLGRSAAALALLLAALLAVLGALAWFVMRDSAERGDARRELAPPALELPKDSAPSTPADAAGLESSTHERGSHEAPREKQAVVLSTAPATLRLLALDAATRAPVANLGFTGSREGDASRELFRGTTDAQGRAEIGGLSEGALFVRTERKPPHAAATAGIVLLAGSTQELTLELGPGSAITGRVVDDRKLPIFDAEIFVGAREGARLAGEPAARSGRDGRFRVECAAEHLAGLSLASGALAAETIEGEALAIRHEAVELRLTAPVDPAKDTDLGDLVLGRAAIFAGRVVDPDGAPVEGALVSPYRQRLAARTGSASAALRAEFGTPLSDPGFALREREQLTGAGGRFELRGDARGFAVVVETREGLLQEFALPRGKPGERAEEIELKLDPRTWLEIELVDARGELVRAPAASPLGDELQAPWRTGHLARDASLYVLTIDHAGATLGGLPADCDPDGIWRVQVRKTPERIDELRVILSGYQPVADKVAGRLRARTRLRYELAAFPLFHLRLVARDPSAPPLAAPGAGLQLHVCLAPPERHGAAHFGHCCGFGVFWSAHWRGETRELALPVRRKGSFWIYARVPAPGGEWQDLEHLGPFEPGESERTLALDPRELEAAASALAAAQDPATRLGDSRAQLAVRIVDARTQLGIAGAELHLAESAPGTRSFADASARSDEKGLLQRLRVPAGTWEISAAARGYRSATLGVREIARDAQLDLGTLALEPAPLHRGRVLGADGKPLAKIYVSRLLDAPAEPNERISGPTGADGVFELFGDLPPSFVLVLGRRVPDEPLVRYEFQRAALELWKEGETLDLHFAPAREVLVTLLGLDPDETSVLPMICPAPGEPTARCDHRGAFATDHIPLERGFETGAPGEPPKYAFRLAPGRYQLFGSSPMHDLPWTEIEVSAGEGALELPITVR